MDIENNSLSLLLQYIEPEKNLPPHLPLIHTFTSKKFDEIVIENNKIKPSHCDFLKGDYSFMFYGNASYRFDGTKSAKNAPIALMFDPSIIENSNGTTFAPFDTGGIEKSIYDKKWVNYFSENLSSYIVELPSLNESNLSKYVALMFGDNSSYIEGENVSNDAVEHECKNKLIEELINFFDNTDNNREDIRKSTVEIHFCYPVDISKYIKMIVVPSNMEGVAERWAMDVEDKYNSLVEVRTYPFKKAELIENYCVVIGNVVDLFYIQNNHLI